MIDFALFGLVLAGIAIFHRRTFEIAVGGLVVIAVFKFGSDFEGLARLFAREWVILSNLFLLLMGFALLSKHFEDSKAPLVLPKILPDDWKGGFMLLAMVFVLSSFLDNIAAALIGGAMAAGVFRRKVHIGYLAAIVAASNAGGSGSVVGDTTTTMMWIAGVSPFSVLEAFIAAGVALLTFGVIAAKQQDAYCRIMKDPPPGVRVDWPRVGIVVFILVVAIAANVTANVKYPEVLDEWPVIGLAVWAAILLSAPVRAPDWSLLPGTLKGTIFLLSLVAAASMMPVEKLPAASWQTAFVLGILSSVFDNIPLTALALHQGGYDWGYLAYAVGFGGSMIWFGSSAGVALANNFPEARSVVAWVRHGWHVALAYVVGFFVMLALISWHPDPPLRSKKAVSPPFTQMAVSNGGVPEAD